MKSLLIILFIGFASAVNAEPLKKSIAGNFILDNIFKPLAQDLKNNTISFLLNLPVTALFGKRDVSEPIQLNIIDKKSIAGNFIMDNIFKPLAQDLKNNTISFLLNLPITSLFGKRDVSDKIVLKRSIAGNFILDNILKPLGQDLKNNTISFLVNLTISSLFGGKRDVSDSVVVKSLAGNFIMDNIFKPLTQDLKNNTISFLLNLPITALFGGKRQGNPVQDLIVEFSVKLEEISNDFGSNLSPILEKLQSSNSIVKLQGKIDYAKLNSETQKAIQDETDDVIQKVTEIFKGIFGPQNVNTDDFKQGIAQLKNVIEAISLPLLQQIQSTTSTIENLTKD